MDFESYRKKYFTHPRPEPRFRFTDSFGVTLYFETYEAAVRYYSKVLRPPGYVEGEGTNGWQIGRGWLTLLKGKTGNLQNVEVTFVMGSAEEA